MDISEATILQVSNQNNNYVRIMVKDIITNKLSSFSDKYHLVSLYELATEFEYEQSFGTFINYCKVNKIKLSYVIPGMQVTILNNTTNIISLQLPNCNDHEACKSFIDSICHEDNIKFVRGNDEIGTTISQSFKNDMLLFIPENETCFLEYLMKTCNHKYIKKRYTDTDIEQFLLYCNCLQLMIDKANFMFNILNDLRNCKELKTMNIKLGILFKIAGMYNQDYMNFRENPYACLSLLNTSSAVQFKYIDTLGGFYKLSIQTRYNGVLWYVLRKAIDSGHTCINVQNTLNLVKMNTIHKDIKFLSDDKLLLRNASCGEEDIVIVKNKNNKYVYLKKYYRLEKNIGEKLRIMMNERNELCNIHDINNSINEYEYEHKIPDFKLDALQKEAVQNCLIGSNINCITGGPGKGKSEVVNCIRHICEKNDINVLVVAPTGKASTKIDGKTIHKVKYGHQSEKKSANKLEKQDFEFKFLDTSDPETLLHDFVIIDETSMVDVELAWDLIKLCKLTTKILFVGDVDQLPSISCGELLRDIKSNVDLVRFDKNYRNDNSINELAESIISNRLPERLNVLNSDQVTLIEMSHLSTTNEMKQKVLELYDKYKEDIQIITPYNDAEKQGIDLYNSEIHKILDIKGTGAIFLKNEKLIGTKNYYVNDECVISNGLSCLFNNYDYEDNTMCYVTINEVSCHIPMEYLQLAHAITVHKSQGDEYQNVIMILPSYSNFITKELVYTGITRAKKHLFIVSSIETLLRCCGNKRQSRLTLLSSFIKNTVKRIKIK